MKKLFFTSILIAFALSNAWAQTTKVINGASSIDLLLTSPKEGTFYYALYSVKPSVTPSALLVKTPNKTNLARSGSVAFSSSELNTNLVHTLAGLSESTTTYLYVVFAPAAGDLGTVSSFTVALPSRQPVLSYTSKVTSTLNRKIDYLLYKPEAYIKDTTQRKFPLLLNIHGVLSGVDANAIKGSGIHAYISGKNDVDFLVASPRNTGWPGNWYSPGTLDEFMKLIKTNERVDPDKIYVTGLSGGAGGTYFYSAGHPEEIAAILAVCCINTFLITDPYWTFGQNYCLIKDIPYWAFHNSGDGTVTANNSRTLVEGLNKCNPKPLFTPKYTIYPVGGHDAWTVTFKNKSVYNWMLGYTKANPLNKQPVLTGDSLIKVTSALVDFDIRVNASDPDNTGSLSYEWLLMSGGDLTLKGATTNKLTIADYAPGTYQLRLLVTDSKGARTFKDMTLVISSPNITTDLDEVTEMESSSAFVFPNPAQDKLNFKLAKGEQIAYRIISLTGNVLLEGVSDTVDVSSLPRGIYAVETLNGVFKFSKE